MGGPALLAVALGRAAAPGGVLQGAQPGFRIECQASRQRGGGLRVADLCKGSQSSGQMPLWLGVKMPCWISVTLPLASISILVMPISPQTRPCPGIVT